MRLTLESFHERTLPLMGLEVSQPWCGYGSAIFLELGELLPAKSQRTRYARGQACISVKWDWRVEAQGVVLYGSSNSYPSIAEGISALRGATVTSIAVAGQVPELVVHFSNGHCLKSMVMVTGDPQWSIRVSDQQRIRACGADMECGDGTGFESLSPHEQATFDLAEQANLRWGQPESAPAMGRCAACTSFIPLDGPGYWLDWGCCAAPASPFDGKAVARTSGCPAFRGVEPDA